MTNPDRMYDSVTASDIPSGAGCVAGYCDLWSPSDWALFPNAIKIRIARSASLNDGDFLDVETGDATPEQAPGWVNLRRNSGKPKAGVYMNTSTWPSVKAAFAAQNISPPPYWVAQYDNNPTIPAGAVAKQYANSPLTGGHYDLSSLAPDFPYFNKDTFIMYIIVQTPNNGIWLLAGSKYAHVDNPTVLTSLRATGACAPHDWVIDDAMHQLLLAHNVTGSVSGTLTLS